MYNLKTFLIIKMCTLQGVRKICLLLFTGIKVFQNHMKNMNSPSDNSIRQNKSFNVTLKKLALSQKLNRAIWSCRQRDLKTGLISLKWTSCLDKAWPTFPADRKWCRDTTYSSTSICVHWPPDYVLCTKVLNVIDLIKWGPAQILCGS